MTTEKRERGTTRHFRFQQKPEGGGYCRKSYLGKYTGKQHLDQERKRKTQNNTQTSFFFVGYSATKEN